MNQDQRKFLLARVEQTYRTEQEKLRNKMPKEPSLNNYLVAAALDGSLKLKSIEEIKKHVKDTVIKLGHSETLVHEERSRYDSEKNYHAVTLKAGNVFEFPEAYKAAMLEYETAKNHVQKEMDKLFSQKETILLKIQIGSNAVLDRLIDEVDNMIDLSVINSKLMLKE
jgi:hypothetical protein